MEMVRTYMMITRVKCLFASINYLNILCIDLELSLNLRFVRIYFDATTFDQIEKDRADKFVDMLSAIGGTMGLLTGFSIISGVEIVYFAVKICHQAMRKIISNGKPK